MWYYWWGISDVDMQEHWWHCLLWFRHHVPQEEEETPRDLGSAELWAPCPHFIWPKGGKICGSATAMAEYSRHTEAPQASGRPFKDHKDAAPAYEGKRWRPLGFPVPWGDPSWDNFALPHIYLNGLRVGSVRNLVDSLVWALITLSFFWGDSDLIRNKDSRILSCSSVTVQITSWLPVTVTRTCESSRGSWQGLGCVQLLYREVENWWRDLF